MSNVVVSVVLMSVFGASRLAHASLLGMFPS